MQGAVGSVTGVGDLSLFGQRFRANSAIRLDNLKSLALYFRGMALSSNMFDAYSAIL